MSSTGTVKFFNKNKGYGFVTHNETNEDYFVHTSDVEGNPLMEGDSVQFEISEGNDGRSKAISVSGGSGNPNDQGGYGGRGGFGNRSGGYGGNQGGFGGNQGGYGGSYGGNQGGYGGNSSYGQGGGFGNRRPGGFGGQGDGQKKICYNWRDNGECRFGDRCRFSHDATQ